VTLLDLLRPLTPSPVQQRAFEYTKRIRNMAGDAAGVWASVRGTTTYEVELSLERHTLVIFCSCPYFADHLAVCKHLWATAVVAAQKGWLTDLPNGTRVAADQAAEDDFDFLSDLEADAEDMPPAPDARHAVHEWPPHGLAREMPSRGHVPQRVPAPPRPPDWARALQALTPPADDRSVWPWAGSQLIYVISAPSGVVLRELPLSVERLDRKKNGEWSKPQPARLTFDMIAQLPDEADRWAVSLLHAVSSFPRAAGSYGYGPYAQPLGPVYLRSAMIDVLLPRLCATGRVRLRRGAGPYRSPGHSGESADQEVTLSWDAHAPWRFMLDVVRLPDDASTAAEARGYRADAVSFATMSA